MGAACSEVFSGPRLAKVLRPSVGLQCEALKSLENSEAIRPLSAHTSLGFPMTLGHFVTALEKHLPWSKTDDWFVNFQLDGASAVWAGLEALGRLRHETIDPPTEKRFQVAVAENSYHGPKTTSVGGPAEPRWPGAPRTSGQVFYPNPFLGRSEDNFKEAFAEFLAVHQRETGIIVIEPQWGSSNSARPWPRHLLQWVVKESKAAGLLVLCDEIMCGLGRHGQGTLFLSDAWGLDPDAVTFGKAIAGGFPLAGVIMKAGAIALKDTKLMQSHTYAGSSSLAILTATEVLTELPQWFEHARLMGEVAKEILGPVSGSFVAIQGQGLMWGLHFLPEENSARQEVVSFFKGCCSKAGVWPYFVAVGCMLTPPMDVEESEWRLALSRIATCLTEAREHFGFSG